MGDGFNPKAGLVANGNGTRAGHYTEENGNGGGGCESVYLLT